MTDKKQNELVTTEYHKLYKYPDTRIDDGEIIKFNDYRLYISDFSSSNFELNELAHHLQLADKNDRCHVYIQSPGGNADEGIAIMNVLHNAFPYKVTTEILYFASSMGSLLFCSGNKRVISKYSRHMMHNYSTSYHQIKASDLKNRVGFFDAVLRSVMEDAYLSTEMLTSSEFELMMDGKEYWFDADEMLKRRIATHIRVDGELIEAAAYLENNK